MENVLVKTSNWEVPYPSCVRTALLRPTALKPSPAFLRMAMWYGTMQFLVVKVCKKKNYIIHFTSFLKERLRGKLWF